jgi:hypothetical protein
MSEPLKVDVFAEDAGHARFLEALIPVVATAEQAEVRLITRSARGGHGRVLSELELHFRLQEESGDVLVVAIDANCNGWNKVKTEIEARIPAGRYVGAAIACPDPHIERWYMADPVGLKDGPLEVTVRVEKRKCERNRYKIILEDGLRAAGHPVRLGGIEFAPEIVAGMDLYRACSNEPSLRNFIDSLKRALRLARDAQEGAPSD